MINIGICDDEQNVLKSISKILESCIINLDLDAEIVIQTTEQADIISAIKNKEIDILFLDIDFKNSERNGIKLAKELRALNSNFKLIFLTGHFEYSLLAYKCKTFDYVLKPITYQNLMPTVKRLKADLENDTSNFVKISKNFSLRADEILFIERNKSKAIVYTLDNNYSSSYSLSSLLEELPSSFIRIHRSYIINQDKIKVIDRENKLVVFDTNISCPIGNFKEL